VSKALAERSSLSHCVRALVSAVVAGELTVGMATEPSKWPHEPFALMASLKCIENAVQFKPVASFGTEERRMSVVVRAVVVIVVEGT
jgi:hypothetical protein